MKIIVIGAGAIGCLIGGKVAGAGHDVVLVGRPRFAAAVARNGLRLIDEEGAHTIRTLTATGGMAEVKADPATVDAAILTVKSYDTATALDELAGYFAGAPDASPLVLSMQNGVGNEEAIAGCFGPEQTAAGVLMTPVSVPESGVIQVDRPRYTMGISPWTDAVEDRRFDALARTLRQAGFDLTSYANPQSMKWTKLLMNMLGNATCAILDTPPADVFADPALSDLEIEAWREALRVMQAMGVAPVNMGSYPFGLLAPAIRRAPKGLLRTVLRRLIGGARGGKMPSMHIDLHSGRGKSEVGWLNGAVVRYGQEFGVPTPVNRGLTETVTGLLNDETARAAWRGDRDRLLAVCHMSQPHQATG